MILRFLLVTFAVCTNFSKAGRLRQARGTGNTDFFNASRAELPRSILRWDSTSIPNTVAILSAHVGHHADSQWFIASLHDDNSEGRNASYLRHAEFGDSFACYIKFFGLGLEKYVKGFEMGGTAQLKISYTNTAGKEIWEGYDSPITCYYTTSYNLGSDFIDSPKTYGIVIYCPLALDQEIGTYGAKKRISQGKFCRPIAEDKVAVELSFTASTRRGPSTIQSPDPINSKLSASFTTHPAMYRVIKSKEPTRASRPHAVCVVQTFRNPQTGPMLYMFAAYWLKMGWRVIIYDRFGMHKEFIWELLKLPGLDYHPYTVFQMAQPTVYNEEYLKKLSFEDKFFYKKEKKFGKYLGTQADTANQDHDKSRTYDYCRLEYSYLDMILFIDSDEYFFCPLQGQSTVRQQRKYQQRLMAEFVGKGIDEVCSQIDDNAFSADMLLCR